MNIYDALVVSSSRHWVYQVAFAETEVIGFIRMADASISAIDPSETLKTFGSNVILFNKLWAVSKPVEEAI